MNDHHPKLAGARRPQGDSEDLTCSEGQVEDLLSEGESTEDDSEEEKVSEPHAGQDASSRKTTSTNLHGRRQT